MPTDNYDLHTPEKGTTDWHVLLNENFDTVDAAIAGAKAANADTGPCETTVVGSSDPDSPREGLAERLQAAIDDGTSHIDVRGAWTMDGEVAFSSEDAAPFGVRIDAWGAAVYYGGSGWAFTNDNTGFAGSALHGGALDLEGGFWRATGNPDGFVRLVDSGGCYLYPRQTWGWNATGKDAAVYQIEEGEQWCESNHLGGRHHLLDIGVRSVASRGTSFQDHTVDSIHLSQVKQYGFDFSGNWIDCTILNPTVIVNQADVAFLRHNGNMGGTEIIAPELESAGNDPDRFYICEVGPRAAFGPQIRGGKLGLTHDNIVFFETSEAPSNWSFGMDYTRDHLPVRAAFGDEGGVRWRLAFDGLHRERAAFERGDWMPAWETEARL